MNYKTNVQFLDWLIWEKDVNEQEWFEASEETKEAWFKEFKKQGGKENEIKFVPIYKGKFNKVAKPSLIKRIVKALHG